MFDFLRSIKYLVNLPTGDMLQLILKKDIEQSKLDALLQFLKSCDIEAELRTSNVVDKKKTDFSLSIGMWKDYDIDANELRTQAWNKKK